MWLKRPSKVNKEALWKVQEMYSRLRAERPGYISVRLIAQTARLSEYTTRKMVRELKIDLLSYQKHLQP